MSQALFVSANRLKRDTAIGGSVDDDLIRPYVYMAQQRWILPVLGTKLYDKISADIDAGTVTGDYETLLNDYIIPSTVQYSFVQLVPFLRLRFVNNAVVVMNSEQSTAATYDDLKPLMDQALDMATFYRERLIDYICNNSTLFPEYNTNTGSRMPKSHCLRPSIRTTIARWLANRSVVPTAILLKHTWYQPTAGYARITNCGCKIVTQLQNANPSSVRRWRGFLVLVNSADEEAISEKTPIPMR